MGYSPWGHKESDTTERLHSLSFPMYILYIELRVYIYIYIHTIVCSAIVYSPTVNIGVHVSFRIRTFVFSKYMLRNGIAGSCDKSVLSF